MKIHIIRAGGTITSYRSEAEGIAPPESEGSEDEFVVANQFIDRAAKERIALEKDAIHPDARGVDFLEVDDLELTHEVVADVDSADISPAHWRKIYQSVQRLVDSKDPPDGFVVLHGTNTLAYTAAALTFALGGVAKPVVVTGSQIPIKFAVSDALNNLLGSIKLIKRLEHERARGALRSSGVFAVFGTRIISGARAKKVSSRDFDGFHTFNIQRDFGSVGQEIIVGGDVLDEIDHSRLMPFLRGDQGEFSDRVVSITCHPGMRSDLYEGLLDGEGCGLEGVVLRAFGEGDPPSSFYSFLASCKDREIPVVATTQIAEGVSTMRTNQPGIKALEEFGLVPAWDMSIEAMTTKLMWLLRFRNLGYQEVRRLMITNLHGEIGRGGTPPAWADLHK